MVVGRHCCCDLYGSLSLSLFSLSASLSLLFSRAFLSGMRLIWDFGSSWRVAAPPRVPIVPSKDSSPTAPELFVYCLSRCTPTWQPPLITTLIGPLRPHPIQSIAHLLWASTLCLVISSPTLPLNLLLGSIGARLNRRGRLAISLARVLPLRAERTSPERPRPSAAVTTTLLTVAVVVRRSSTSSPQRPASPLNKLSSSFNCHSW